MRFSTLRLQNLERNNESFPTCSDWSATDWATALAGEVGELCNFIKKHRRGDVIEVADIGKELADVVIYADLLATYFNLDLAWYVVEKFNEVSKRVGSTRKLAHFDEYEKAKLDAEIRVDRLEDFLKEKELLEEFEEWNREVDLELSN